jgi:hypothetical protein
MPVNIIIVMFYSYVLIEATHDTKWRMGFKIVQFAICDTSLYCMLSTGWSLGCFVLVFEAQGWLDR